MRARIIAYTVMMLTVALTLANTLVLCSCIDRLASMLEEADPMSEEGAAKILEAKKYYEEREGFISLTVNHEDLTDIKDAFCEIEGCISIGDGEGATVVKSRLVGSVEHLRRLSGFNFDSIL